MYAIVSDLHSNIEALQAVLADVPAGATLLHLGDVVGYGPDPNGVIGVLGDTLGVVGNHDVAALGDAIALERMNPAAAFSAAWTGEVLTPASRAYLEQLPRTRVVADSDLAFTLSHGSPDYPEDFEYVLDDRAALRAMAAVSTQVCFIGHSHLPESFARVAGSDLIARQKRGVMAHIPDELAIVDGTQYLVNVGSVGQPRDHDPRASYVIFDTNARAVSWRRVRYSTAAVLAKIELSPLPLWNGERLVEGR